MINLYKDLHAAYWGGALLICIIAIVLVSLLPGYREPVFLVCICLLVVNMLIISRIAKNRFADEVLVLMTSCRINEYIDKLDLRMGKKKSAIQKSAYGYMKAMGYFLLGDAEHEYECTNLITARSHQTERIKYLADYYISTGDYDEAREILGQMEEVAARERSDIYRETLFQFIQMQDYRMRINNGDYEGAEEFYLEEIGKSSNNILLHQVALRCALGNLLVLKGENERAAQYLEFASQKGGDTKFKKHADELLARISA